MNYIVLEKNNETYFKYKPTKNFKKIPKKIDPKNNPFKILKDINFN